MNESARYFAVIPAAGHSRRMGRPKLLLPMAADGSAVPAHRESSRRQGVVARDRMIDRVLRAWTTSRVDQVVIVVRKDDQALQDACRDWPAHLVTPESDPVDMKQSIQSGLRYVRSTFGPTHTDGCFLAPADLPGIDASVIDRLRNARDDENTIVVAKFGDRPGHPILLPWPMTAAIDQLGDDEGIDVLVRRSPLTYVPFPESSRLTDVDTPDDYRAVLDRARSARRDAATDRE